MGSEASSVDWVMAGGAVQYVLVMCVWQLLYFFGYAIFFHEDEHSDFALFFRPSTSATTARKGSKA